MLNKSNLSVLAYSNGFTQWHYKSEEDTKEAIEEKGYFKDVEKLLLENDLIMVNAKDENFIMWYKTNNK